LTALLGPEFDAFLFAQVDEESSGRLLSVLSALARLDVDPWREATELARMPRESANQRLTSLIAALPAAPAGRLPAATIADRLIRLLPRATPSLVASRDGSLRANRTPTSRTIANMVLINLLVAASGTVIPETPRAGCLN
jgi:hypothetical protein